MLEGFHLPLIKGWVSGASLIMAIGAQNAFVLRQGLMRNQVWLTAIFCTIVDGTMISIGVGGVGQILTSNQILLLLAKWGGAAFLFWYGFRSFRSVFKTQALNADAAIGPPRPSFKETLVTLAALSFLNPGVYLDTVVLLGTIGSQFEQSARPYFAIGAIFASFCWFFGVCFGARALSRFFQSHKAWKVLDCMTGCMMWGIAITLLWMS